MKTSNKILIGLLTTIFLTITAAFIDIRVFGVHRSERKIVKHEENFPLQRFRHISFEGQRKNKVTPYINIKHSDKNLIKIENYADTMVYSFAHQIINDTLKIICLIDKPFMHSFTLYANSNIESISTEGTNIEINGLRQDSIKLYLNHGEIQSWGKDSTKLSKFKKLKVEQINARLNLHNLQVDTLEIDMVKSKAGFVNDIMLLNAKVKDQSNLQLRNVSEVKFTKDDSSKIYFH